MVLEVDPKSDLGATTTIKITVHAWKCLSALKNPGDSFSDVVQRLLDEKETKR